MRCAQCGAMVDAREHERRREGRASRGKATFETKGNVRGRHKRNAQICSRLASWGNERRPSVEVGKGIEGCGGCVEHPSDPHRGGRKNEVGTRIVACRTESNERKRFCCF